jgi:thioredoxin 1
MSEIILTKESFDQQVLKADKPVVVDFWATWCGPCKMLAPILSEAATALDGKAIVGKVNVDEQMDLAIEYKIEVIPTLLFFKDGQLVKKSVGVIDKDEIISIVANL